MKQTFTLTTLMLLTVTLSFGQTKSLKNLLKKDGKHSRGLQIIGLNSKSSSLKSTQDYTLKMDSVVEYSSYDEATETYSSHLYDDKYVFSSYNNNGYLSEGIDYWFDEENNNGWSANTVDVFTYDENNNVTSYYEYSYDEEAEDHIGTPDYKEEYSYDDNGYISMCEESNYSDGSWVPAYKEEYSNDDNGNCTQEIDYYYEDDEYLYESKQETSYDDNNQITSLIIYSYDEDWEIEQECTNAIDDGIVYNNDGYIEQAIMGKYVDATTSTGTESVWVNSFKVTFEYDSNNNLTDEIEYDYDNGDWVKSDDGAYTYDSNYTISDIYSTPAVYNFYDYELLSEPINNIVTAQIDYTYDESENESFDGAKKFYYSEITTTSVDKTESDAISIYPNPVSSSFTVNFSNSDNTAVIELYNVTGNKLMSKEIGSGESVNIDNYTSGIYFYTLTVNGKTQNGKLLKK